MKQKLITICKYELKFEYYVRDDGTIYSARTNKVLSPQLDKDGYQKVQMMSTDGKAPGSNDPGACSLMKDQQQELLLQPLLQPPQLPLPQQQKIMISRMMIQQQFPPPQPLLHIS